MYFLLSLKDSCIKKIVPSKWIKDLEVTKFLNYGLFYQRHKIYTTFYSKNVQEEPDFQLEVRSYFCDNKSGCYEAFIIKSFGKCLIASICQVCSDLIRSSGLSFVC